MAATVGLSPGLIAAILNAYRGSTFTIPAFYLQLHTAIPGGAGSTAISSGDSSRELLTFSPSASNAIAMTGNPPSWMNGGTEGETVTHVSAHSAATGGTFWQSGELDTPITWDTNDTITINSLSIPLGPVAAS